MTTIDLSEYGLTVKEVHHNLSCGALYEHAIHFDKDSSIADNGALVAYSGGKTGRSPKDKRVVKHPDSENDIWWGSVNIPLEHQTFAINRERALDYLNTRERLYCFDGFAGWDPKYRIKTRIFTELAWHSLFIRQLLIRPVEPELEDFVPEFTIVDLASFKADPKRHGVRSETIIAIDFTRKIILIGGSSYAGEIKKSVFTTLNFYLPAQGVMPMHCSANVGKDGDVALFFGLSGTGKTTLSADPDRILIGDDEHGWDRTVYSISRAAATPNASSCRKKPSLKSTPPPIASRRFWKTWCSIRTHAFPTSMTTPRPRTRARLIRSTSCRGLRPAAAPDIPGTSSSSRPTPSA